MSSLIDALAGIPSAEAVAVVTWLAIGLTAVLAGAIVVSRSRRRVLSNARAELRLVATAPVEAKTVARAA